jgi:hypothetical protein
LIEITEMSAIKRILPLLIIWLTFSLSGLAQPTTDFIVNAGEVATHVIPIEEQYRFPQFDSGEVYFRDNTFIRATLNYHLLYGEMQFINHKGDTLALTEEYRLKLITVGKHVFFYAYKTGYLEVVSNYPQVKLARKQHLGITKSEVDLTSRTVGGGGAGESGMNGQFNTGSGLSGKDWNLRELYTQKSPGDLYLAKNASYFIIDKNDRFYPAKKATVIKLFPRYKKAIDAYIKKYKPDFNLRNDLQGLLAFCSQLSVK